jgi:hypothetical protein
VGNTPPFVSEIAVMPESRRFRAPWSIEEPDPKLGRAVLHRPRRP